VGRNCGQVTQFIRHPVLNQGKPMDLLNVRELQLDNRQTLDPTTTTLLNALTQAKTDFVKTAANAYDFHKHNDKFRYELDSRSFQSQMIGLDFERDQKRAVLCSELKRGRETANGVSRQALVIIGAVARVFVDIFRERNM
jgi:hypothetical protein